MKIIVNGLEHEVKAGQLSYAEVVQLAFGLQEVSTDFMMTYRGPRRLTSLLGRSYQQKSGTLIPNQVIPIEPDMVFNVARTGNA